MAHGFNFITNSKNQAMNCIATCLSASSATETFGAIGFDFNTTTSNSLTNCTSSDHTTGSSSSALGFKILNGFCNTINNSKAERNNFGFRVDPDEVPAQSTHPHVFYRNQALCNADPGDNSYVGFPNGSIEIADDIDSLNSNLNGPWSNIAIGNTP